MMVSSEETIKNLQNEVLRLKLIVFQQERMLEQRGRPPGQDLDETKKDLIADLMITNDELRKQIQDLESREPIKEPSEPERPEMKNAACQTNLDRLNIEQLIEASLTLKRHKRQQLQQHEQLMQQRQEALRLQQEQHQHQQYQNQHHHQQQPNYQEHYPLSQQPTTQQNQFPQYNQHQQQPQHPHAPMQKEHFHMSNRQMTIDEKESLDKLFRLDGLLTTARDRLRAIALN